jgi:arginine deiminase
MKNASMADHLRSARIESEPLPTRLFTRQSAFSAAKGCQTRQNRLKHRHFRSYFAQMIFKAANLADILHKCMAVA